LLKQQLAEILDCRTLLLQTRLLLQQRKLLEDLVKSHKSTFLIKENLATVWIMLLDFLSKWMVLTYQTLQQLQVLIFKLNNLKTFTLI
jgi:hypothetical protein